MSFFAGLLFFFFFFFLYVRMSGVLHKLFLFFFSFSDFLFIFFLFFPFELNTRIVVCSIVAYIILCFFLFVSLSSLPFIYLMAVSVRFLTATVSSFCFRLFPFYCRRCFESCLLSPYQKVELLFVCLFFFFERGFIVFFFSLSVICLLKNEKH